MVSMGEEDAMEGDNTVCRHRICQLKCQKYEHLSRMP